MYRFLSLLAVGCLFGAEGVSGAVFTGSTVFHGIWSTSGVFAVTWDLSGVSVADTPYGSEITGTIRGTYTGAPAGGSSAVAMYATRNVSAAISSEDLMVTAALTATASGPATVSMRNYAWVSTSGGSVCTVSATVSTGPVSTTCNIDEDFPGFGLVPQSLRTDFSASVIAFAGGDGTVTIDLGSSATGELRVLSEVPEPSALLLIGAALPLFWLRRSYQR